MKDTSELTGEELRIYNILVDYLISKAAEWKQEFNEKENFPRWTTTWLLSLSCKETAIHLRKTLSALEKNGFVEAQRRPNHISWSPIQIPGFKKHHQFRDYMVPVD
jgi:hypothetical protein